MHACSLRGSPVAHPRPRPTDGKASALPGLQPQHHAAPAAAAADLHRPLVGPWPASRSTAACSATKLLARNCVRHTCMQAFCLVDCMPLPQLHCFTSAMQRCSTCHLQHRSPHWSGPSQRLFAYAPSAAPVPAAPVQTSGQGPARSWHTSPMVQHDCIGASSKGSDPMQAYLLRRSFRCQESSHFAQVFGRKVDLPRRTTTPKSVTPAKITHHYGAKQQAGHLVSCTADKRHVLFNCVDQLLCGFPAKQARQAPTR